MQPDGPDTQRLDLQKATLSVSESCENTGQMSLFGTTCERSMQETSPLLWTPTAAGNYAAPSMATRDPGSWFHSSPQAIPANHSHSPGSDWARKMTATYGRKSGDYWLSCDPPDSWVKTLLGISTWASTSCYLTWKKSVTPHGRLLFRLVPSTPRTAGIGSGSLLHTPTVAANQSSPSMVERDKGSWRLWGTPTSRDHKDTGNLENVPVNGLLGRQDLDRMWGTPRAVDYKQSGPNVNYERGAARSELPGMVMVGADRSMKLNSAWVGRMMGYPDSWLDLTPDGEAIP